MHTDLFIPEHICKVSGEFGFTPVGISVVYCIPCKAMKMFVTVLYHIPNPYSFVAVCDILGTDFTTVEIKHIFERTYINLYVCIQTYVGGLVTLIFLGMKRS